MWMTEIYQQCYFLHMMVRMKADNSFKFYTHTNNLFCFSILTFSIY